MNQIEAMKQALEAFEQGLGHLARDTLRAAIEQALARPSGYAGATVWIGDKTVTQVVTETQVKYEREPGQMITYAAQECLDLLANQVAAPQLQRDDTALLRQALEALEWCEPAGTVGAGGIAARRASIDALKERLK
jgi:hypothetical protein